MAAGDVVFELNKQTDWTGEWPTGPNTRFMWRFNDTNVTAANPNTTDSSGNNRTLEIVNYSGTTANFVDGIMNRYFTFNTSAPATEKTYLQYKNNDENVLKTLGDCIVFGGWVYPMSYTVGNTNTQIMTTRNNKGGTTVYQPLFHLAFSNTAASAGKPRLIMYNASGASIGDTIFTSFPAMLAANWYHLAVRVHRLNRTVEVQMYHRVADTFYNAQSTISGEWNASCVADIIMGNMGANTTGTNYWYSGRFDDWFFEAGTPLSIQNVHDYIADKHVPATGGEAGNYIDTLTNNDGAVRLARSGAVYQTNGQFTTVRSRYNNSEVQSGFIEVDADIPSGTSITIESAAGDGTWRMVPPDGEIKSSFDGELTFRVTLNTTVTSVTPVLRAIRLIAGEPKPPKVFKRVQYKFRPRNVKPIVKA